MVDEKRITMAGSFACRADVDAIDWQKRLYSGTERMSSTTHFESVFLQSASPSSPSSMRKSSLLSENHVAFLSGLLIPRRGLSTR